MDVKGETPSVLERTAPGLFHALRRAFPEPVVAELGSLYESAVGATGLEAPSIPRAPGVSFNPWPARICRILLTEGECSARTLGTALASLVDRGLPSVSHLIEPETVTEVREAFTSAETRLSAEGEGIVLAFILDEVRHLHLSTLERAARIAAVERARRRLEGIGASERWSRLLTLVRHAVSRWD